VNKIRISAVLASVPGVQVLLRGIFQEREKKYIKIRKGKA
jgi:hypothetical protein